ncbi:hypothetical protein [Sphingobium vermicomposti]|uniref:Uncharacterized protein n=1 Tax=Sphingobium vermicomposti TaxID=529005 RepID=A0A846M941_9SPHN|nr:hypothetical protein [Sphingobium vermicomposti]NIJ17963.1 hypothetical protein [Sphingobium vermicomposti]
MGDREGDHQPDNAQTPRGPLGDTLPGREKEDPRTVGGQEPEDVEDRPNVGTVRPEDYPEKDRDDSQP